MEGVTFAATILQRAIALDTAQKYTESLICYQEGIQILLGALKNISDDSQRMKIRTKADEYMKRAEAVKDHIEKLKKAGNYREQIQIDEGATGYSYDRIFSRFLDASVCQVEVDDPYIRSPHQCDNFLRFVELCLKLCPNLSRIHLKTGQDDNPTEQKRKLTTICRSVANLPERTVEITVDYSGVLHDREIRLDNGWVIKIGRGLDYFKPVDRSNVGWSDYYFRPCRATTVDIFHNKDLHRCHFK